MSQQIKVERDIQFIGPASKTNNVEGDFAMKRWHFYDPFMHDSQANYTATLDGTNDAIAALAGGYPGLSLLSGDTDNEVSFLGTGLIFDATYNPVIECKVRITDISQTSFFFGFSDANTETTPASTIDYADATLAAAATDAAGFVSDADKSSSQFYAASIKTGGSVVGTATGVTPTDTSTHILRVEITPSLTVIYYIDEVQVDVDVGGVTDVPLCAIWNFGTRDNGGGDAVYLYYFKAWQGLP